MLSHGLILARTPWSGKARTRRRSCSLRESSEHLAPITAYERRDDASTSASGSRGSEAAEGSPGAARRSGMKRSNRSTIAEGVDAATTGISTANQDGERQDHARRLVKVLEFGLAKRRTRGSVRVTDGRRARGALTSGMMLADQSYMSPQRHGAAHWTSERSSGIRAASTR